MKLRRDQKVFMVMMALPLVVLFASCGDRATKWISGVLAPAPTLSPSQSATATAQALTDQATQMRATAIAMPVVVEIASSNTKQDWMDAVVARFNAEGHTISAGNPVTVQVLHGTSGGTQRDMLDGSLRPVVWSPGDYSWVESANEVWRDRTGQLLVSDSCAQTILAPVGLAMWRPMAEALGWPDAPIGWDELIALMAAPDGWGSVGHPEWGTFRFGHTHPEYSNVGMLMMTSLAYRAAQKTAELAPADVYSAAVTDAFRQVELTTYHYGIQSRDLLRLMVTRGPQYLHAVTTSEAETLKTNAEQGAQMRFPLVFVFPSDGTFWGEHPYCVLDGDWVSEEQREAAAVFRDYLLDPQQQALAIDNYLRPVDTSIALHAPLALENGTDPRVTPATVPGLGLPSGEIVDAVVDLFHQTKKPAAVVLVLDTSGSMSGARITSATASASQFVRRLDRRDTVYALGFGSTLYAIGQGGQVADVGEALAATLSGAYADGSTALYDAVCGAAAQIDTLRQEHEAQHTPHLYGIVLLSDGADTSSRTSLNQMFDCLPSGESADGVKVFAIGYEVGDPAIQDILRRVAARTNGRYFDGTTANIDTIYTAISAEQ